MSGARACLGDAARLSHAALERSRSWRPLATRARRGPARAYVAPPTHPRTRFTARDRARIKFWHGGQAMTRSSSEEHADDGEA